MPQDIRCPIWNRPAISEQHGMMMVIDSARAGGHYELDITQRDRPELSDPTFSPRLTTWLINQREQGDLRPRITSEVIKTVKFRHFLSVTERADRLLKFFARHTDVVGGSVGFVGEYAGRCGTMSEMVLAYSESVSEAEVSFLADYLISQNWTRDLPAKNNFVVTVEGYAHLADLEKKVVNSVQGFIAMWFGEAVKEAYERGIHPAIEDAGYKPFRIDRSEHVNRIDDEIVAAIRRSRLLVADFTHGDTGPRGGVYYEAGLAHGLGLPVFWSCRKDVFEQGIHFDLRQYNFIIWETPEELRSRLAARISAVIGDGPYKVLPI